MRNIVERTELCCLLTYLNDDYCIDIHHEILKILNYFHMVEAAHAQFMLGPHQNDGFTFKQTTHA